MNGAPPKRRPRPNLRKLMFVLPNLFTVSSIFCGIYSILLSSEESSSNNFYRAAVAIFFGTFFDAFDGRVARLTKTQSEFGVELDSLADVITFGVAPAILVYKWALSGMGTTGIFICAAYASCGAIRLARFNVLTHREHETDQSGVSRFFVGLPIPLAAGMIVALVWALNNPGVEGRTPVAVLMVVLSFLMVSTVRYRTFKDAKMNLPMLLAFGLVLAIAAVFALTGRVRQVFLVYFSFYILLGLAEEALFGRKRRAAARAAALVVPGGGGTAAAMAAGEGADHDDEEDDEEDDDSSEDLLPAEEDDPEPTPLPKKP
jgi:CDP-diacylglycerol--serine O-phosphatidyltransferase